MRSILHFEGSICELNGRWAVVYLAPACAVPQVAKPWHPGSACPQRTMEQPLATPGRVRESLSDRAGPWPRSREPLNNFPNTPRGSLRSSWGPRGRLVGCWPVQKFLKTSKASLKCWRRISSIASTNQGLYSLGTRIAREVEIKLSIDLLRGWGVFFIKIEGFPHPC